LAASPEVNFLVNILQHISNPHNLVALAAVVNELIRKRILDTALIQHFPIQYIERFSLDKILLDVGIAFNANTLRGLPLYDLCEELIRIFALNVGKYNIYIQFFLDFANKISARQGTHLADLLQAWDEKKGKLSVVVPEGIDAIRIMTIHKAKGLEFPVVIWPMATEKLKTTFDQLWVNLADDVLPGLPVALLQTGNTMEKVGYSAEYEKERNSSMLDMVNLVYVAFTRPSERLYILTREPGKSDSNSLPTLLSQYIESTSETWLQTNNQFTKGLDKAVNKPLKHKVDNNMLSEMISSPWQNRITIARRAPVYWSADEFNNKQAWGTLIHDTLASIRTTDDIADAIALQVATNLLTEEEAGKLILRVTSTVNHEKLKPHFKKDVPLKPEAGILTPNGEVFRPDRVIIYENETVVMEFKTGLPEPKHRQQLENYSKILQQMNYTGIRKLLVYINENVEVMEV
jgi:ATP-dependent exoDNAse (exonuclease V) beta subunit